MSICTHIIKLALGWFHIEQPTISWICKKSIFCVLFYGTICAFILGCTRLSFRHSSVDRSQNNSKSLQIIAAKEAIEIALHEACKKQLDNSSLWELVKAWLALRCKEKWGASPLHHFVKHFQEVQKYFHDLGLYEVMQQQCIVWFIRYYAEDINNVQVIGRRSVAPLHIATKNGNLKLIQLLLECGAHVAVQDGEGDTPLHMAVEQNNLGVVGCLGRYRPNLNAKNLKGCTPLHIAVEYGHIQAVKMLVKLGADVNLADDSGYTPLHIATECCNVTLVELLIALGANINAKNRNGATSLYIAVEHGHVPVAALLVGKDAHVNEQNLEGNTPLHIAAKYCHLDLAVMLVDHGASVNARNRKGNTPLHDLVILRKLCITDLQFFWKTCFFPKDFDALWLFLVSRGASLSIRNHSGQTAVNLKDERKFALPFYAASFITVKMLMLSLSLL